MINNTSLVLDSELLLIDIWVKNSLKRVRKLLKLFWKLFQFLKILALKNDREGTRMLRQLQ